MTKLSIKIIRFCQVFLWLYSKWLVRYWLEVEINKQELSLDRSKQLIVISNHVSRYDPFIIVGSLSWQEAKYIRPIRPMLANCYYYSPLLPFAYLIGSYPARPLFRFLRKFGGTQAAIRYAVNGCTLGIFPEGQRILSHRIPPKYGVIKILEGLENPGIILSLVNKDNSSPRKFKITLKRSDQVSKLRSPDEIMDSIFALSHNIR